MFDAMNSMIDELPPHFAAVENDDDEALQCLLEDTPAEGLFDGNGYTLLELAQHLGSRQCQLLLQPSFQEELKVLRPRHHTLEKMDYETFFMAMGISYCSTLRFSSYESLNDVLKCCPRSAQEGLVALGLVPPEQMHTNHTVVWINNRMGYGLMTNRNLPYSAIVGEYTGLVRQAAWSCPAVNAHCVEYPTHWRSSARYLIDARFWGGLMRYVNHSDTPNLEGRWHCDRNMMHLYFVTNREVRRGEQLTVDYGNAFWRYRQR